MLVKPSVGALTASPQAVKTQQLCLLKEASMRILQDCLKSLLSRHLEQPPSLGHTLSVTIDTVSQISHTIAAQTRSQTRCHNTVDIGDPAVSAG